MPWQHVFYQGRKNQRRALCHLRKGEDWATGRIFELNCLNGHLRNNAYNSVRWGCLVSRGPKREKGSNIQYGYSKWGTHARVFSRTLANGDSQNETGPRDRQERKKRGVSMERSKAGTKERGPYCLSLPNQNTILINTCMQYYFPKYGKSTMKFN